MKKLAILLAAGALIGSATAGDLIPNNNVKKVQGNGKGTWAIDVSLFGPTGDAEDAGVETAFGASINYFFGPFGADSNAEWYAGLGSFFGSGDNDLDLTYYGLHVGILWGLGKPGDDNPWALDLRGGWYRGQAEGEEDVVVKGTASFDEEEDGFGGSIALVYQMKNNGKKGTRFSLGWYTLPKINDADNNGWFFSVGFPFGG